jgi:hypothetical protein
MASTFSSLGEVAGTIASENPFKYLLVENSHPAEYTAKKMEATSKAFTTSQTPWNSGWR